MHIVAFRATPVTPDPDQLSMIRLVDGDVVYRTFILGADPIESQVSYFQVPGDQICLSAIQVNASGQEIESERVCSASALDASGCHAAGSTRSAPLSLFGVALAVCCLGRRRGDSRGASSR
jgi:hypothetical protein